MYICVAGGQKRGEERGTGPPSPRNRKLYKRVALAVYI